VGFDKAAATIAAFDFALSVKAIPDLRVTQSAVSAITAHAIGMGIYGEKLGSI